MIKKNSHDTGHNYYFKKEEYENSRFTEPKSYKGGAFKNNKTLLITLLDIAVIVLIILVVIPFVRKSYEIPDLKGYSLNLSDYRSENNIFLSLSIFNKDKGNSSVADLVDIEFYLENSKEHIFINDLLPLPGKSLTYRISFPSDGSEVASSKVTIKGTSSVLNVKIDKN
ncbi:MAG: hypothetical protein PF693_18160 [Spirochaetia bacterium]|jgi:hypothetical protein|nr:hypothetical protein [Spirochaetia bacterium]